MNAVNRFRFRNTMLIANVISNIIGVTVVFYLFSLLTDQVHRRLLNKPFS